METTARQPGFVLDPGDISFGQMTRGETKTLQLVGRFVGGKDDELEYQIEPSPPFDLTNVMPLRDDRVAFEITATTRDLMPGAYEGTFELFASVGVSVVARLSVKVVRAAPRP